MRSARRSLLILVTGILFVPLLPTAAANHEYQQPVWFNWGSKTLDVLVVSGEDPLVGNAIRLAIDRWIAGIDDLDPNFGLTLRVYWPADDPVPPPGFSADIVVAPQGFFAVLPPFGGTLGTPRCYAFAPMMAGWGTLYSVTSHEFGHCLGLGHVFNHGQEYSPAKDIMGSGAVAGGACPSNLNMQVLAKVFSGQAGTVTISDTAYQQSSCL